MKHFYKTIQGWFNFQDVYDDFLKNAKGGELAVEVGAWKGKSAAYFATEIANSFKNIDFYVVDTWNGSDEPKHHADPHVQAGTLFEHFTDNMKPVRNFYSALRMTSVEASKKFQDNSLNLVLLDAGHGYEDVMADLVHWYPKLRGRGSVIAGDDYNWKGVQKAVNEFFSRMGHEVEVLGQDRGVHWRVVL